MFSDRLILILSVSVVLLANVITFEEYMVIHRPLDRNVFSVGWMKGLIIIEEVYMYVGSEHALLTYIFSCMVICA